MRNFFLSPLKWFQVSKKAINPIIDNYEANKEIQEKLRHVECRSNMYDYQFALNMIYKSIPKQKKVKEAYKPEELTSNVSTDAYNSDFGGCNFFNSFSEKITQNSSNEVILDIATRSFVGSVDSPKNLPLSFELLRKRLDTIKNSNADKVDNGSKKQFSEKELQFYLTYFISNSSGLDCNGSRVNPNKIFNESSYYKAKYVYARDFFKILAFSDDGEKKKFLDSLKLQTGCKLAPYYRDLYNIFKQVSSVLYEADYFIGIIYQTGLIEKENYRRAYYHFSRAASKFHGPSLYEIYLM